MAGYFEIDGLVKADMCMFRLKAADHVNMLTSPPFTSKAECMDGIQSVRENAPNDAHYDRIKTPTDKFRFDLTGADGKVIGESENYDTEAACAEAIEWIKSAAPGAEVKNLMM